MNAVLARLHTDHARLTTLLDFLAGELEKLRTGGEADLARIHDALAYFEDYPTLVHHPCEDLVMERLAERALENQAVRGALHQEHQNLERQTRQLRQDFADALRDDAISREGVAARLRAFVEQQRTHLQTEESMLFPLVERTLTSEDWEVVQAQLPDRSDPLFDETEARFQALYERVVSR